MQTKYEQQGIPDRASAVGRRRRGRPLHAIITLVLAAAAAFATSVVGIPLGTSMVPSHSRITVDVGHMITVCGAIAFFVLALISTFAFARWARSALERFIGAAYGAILRCVMILIGICVVALTTLSLLGFRVTQLVVGGAVTGVLVTIAAQESLSNLFAGVMLQFAKPFKLGDLVQVRSGALAGTIEGTVSEFSITYVRLETERGRVFLPNSQVLAAAVSPLRVNGTGAADDRDPAGLPPAKP